MAERYRHARQTGKREPLSDITAEINTPPAPKLRLKQNGKAPIVPLHKLPHNESLDPDGSLKVRSSQPNSPEHVRLSQISSEHERDPKRNSAISTASTNASGRRRKTYIGHWQLGKTIGNGGCSRVRVVRHRFKDQYGAVKIITRSTAQTTRAQSLANLVESSREGSPVHHGHRPIPYGLEREIAVMKILEHPNIVKLYDVWENRNEIYLIMEYIEGGELFAYVDENKLLPEDETVYIFRQIVSALLYCHRLHICHRDLKPENIMLNKQNLSVKLIDFGMAALQPNGRLLSTPCGSPHYAAPEVVTGEPYDGKQADVWSCAVILYVMLTGATPFNYTREGHLRELFRDIAKANYYMPPELSKEAQSLLKRMFVPDPEHRITMDGVWDHLFMHKYDKQFGYDGPAGTKEAALGPVPTIDQWTVKRVQDVDREILRNMRTLWHSEPEKVLIQKLLNGEYNQEKLFYAALIKHRDEQFENYVGGIDDVDYSASDYHHSRPPRPSDAPPLPTAQRSQSQYSILNDEHLKPSRSFIEPPPSVSSYDPYRASRVPMLDARGEYLNVTVHRNGSASTRKASIGRSLRHPNALRIEMLRHGGRRTSNLSSSSLPRSRHSRTSMARSSMSRNSLTSSGWPSSPPVIATMRPSDLHKRGVSFGHARRSSTHTHLTSQGSSKAPPPATPRSPGDTRERKKRSGEAKQMPLGSSPTAQVAQAVRSRKEKAKMLDTPGIRTRQPNTPSQRLRSDVRKHSVELEKACEEAFFHNSATSSLTARTSLTDKQSQLETPPSSVSGRSQSIDPKFATRPLPELPKDTPNTYLCKTLEETREKLATCKASSDDINAAKFAEVIRMLESIVPSDTPTRVQDQRNFTAPEVKTPDHLGFLPVISEERDERSSKDGTTNWQRSVTAPVYQSHKGEATTIRIVPPSSPGTIAPLRVNKRSNGSQASDETQRRLAAKKSSERIASRQANDAVRGLTVIEEDSTLMSSDITMAKEKKKGGWFGLSKKATSDAGRVTPARFEELDDRLHAKPSRVAGIRPVPASPQLAQSSQSPVAKKRFGGGKKGLSKWLGRKGGEKEGDPAGDTEIGNTTFNTTLNTTFTSHASTNRSMDSFFSSASPSPSGEAPVSTGTDRSWFARFFRIKPAVRVLCFSIPRGRARQELVILLREWQRHGIQDLQYSRETNTITARVDRNNSLNIKPVVFRINIFVMLEHGKKVGLSVARFTQVKGAASGFKRVLEVVDGVMRARGWLVEDEEKWNAMAGVVVGEA